MLRRAFPDLTVTIHDQVEFLGVAPTGKSVEFSVIDILKLRDGKYIEHWACADMLGLLGQLRS